MVEIFIAMVAFYDASTGQHQRTEAVAFLTMEQCQATLQHIDVLTEADMLSYTEGQCIKLPLVVE